MAGQWNYNGNGNNQMTQAQQNAWQDPNRLTPEQIAQMRRNNEADFRNDNDVNDSALRNANPNAWWYGGEGPDAYNAEKAMLERRRQEYANRVGPQVDQTGYNIDRSRDQQSGLQQQAALGMLARTASGQGPSIAQMQAAAAMQQARNSMQGMAASARGGGGNAAAAMRTAMMQGGAMQQGAAQQGGMLRAQEMLAAQNAYAQQANAIRGAEQARMGQGAQWSLGNTAAQQANQRQNDQMANAQDAFRANAMQQNTAGRQGEQNWRQNAFSDINRTELGQQAQSDANTGKAIGTGGTILASLLPFIFSDERLKTGVGNGAGEIRSALDNLSPKSFEYKDGANGEGERLGIMAQDLEKSKYGKSIVQKDGDGMRMVDGGGGLNMALAAIADLHQRMKKFEGKK